MKIFEVLEPVAIDPDKHEVVDNLRSYIKDMFGEEPQKLGSGAFGIVYEKPDDPGTAIKVSKGASVNRIKNDGYLTYIAEIAKSRKSSGNTYLPKIYSVNFYFDLSDTDAKDSIFRGPAKYVIEMERLEPLLSKAEWNDSGGYDVDDDDPHSHVQQYLNLAKRMFKDYEANYFNKIDIAYDIANNIYSYIAGRPPKYKIKDRQLLEALVVVRRAINKSGGGADMQVTNIMLRRTPYGIQLVITDPVS